MACGRPFHEIILGRIPTILLGPGGTPTPGEGASHMGVPHSTLAALAERLRRAAQTRIPTAPIRDELPEGDAQAAHTVQRINTDHWLHEGRRLIGRKIGLTSKVVQKQLEVGEPDFGMLFADMALCDGEQVPLSQVMQPKVEAEVALVLERNLPQAAPTVAEAISAVAYAVPAIEIVGSRIAEWNIRLTDTIADNASAGLFVPGATPVKRSWGTLCARWSRRRAWPPPAESGSSAAGS
jgi:2-keto-4-pentenoate hydratase